MVDNVTFIARNFIFYSLIVGFLYIFLIVMFGLIKEIFYDLFY